MNGKNELQDRLENFSISIIVLIKEEKITYQFRNIIDQLLRSATSIGANYSEAQHAISRADFRNKIHISAKEAQESLYWLRLLQSVGVCDEARLTTIHAEATEITKILCSITRKVKS